MLEDEEVRALLAGVSRRDEPSLFRLGSVCEALVKRALQGKFSQALAMRWVTPEDLTDGLNEGLLSLWEKPRDLHTVSDVRGWLFQCASNHLTDLLRRNKTYRSYVKLLDEDEEADYQEVADESLYSSPAHCLVSKQRSEAIGHCLGLLKSNKTRAAWLAWANGASTTEIAALTGQAVESVKSGMRITKDRLAQCLQSLGVDGP